MNLHQALRETSVQRAVTARPRPETATPVEVQLRKWIRAGDEEFYQGQWGRAREAFVRVLGKVLGLRVRSSSAYVCYADAARNLASLSLLQGDAAGAAEHLQQAKRFVLRITERERWLVVCDNALCEAYGARQEGRFADALRLLDGIPSPDSPGDRRYLRVRRALELASLARNLGFFHEATLLLEGVMSARATASERPDAPEVLRMMTTHYLGVTWMERAVYLRDEAAVGPAVDALTLSRALAAKGQTPQSNQLYVVRNDKALGWMHLCRGDVAAAESVALDAMRRARDLGDVKTEILARVLDGAAALQDGRADAGADALRQALAECERIRYWRGSVAAWTFLGRDALARGSRPAMQQAVEGLRRLGQGVISPLLTSVVGDLERSFAPKPPPAEVNARLLSLYGALDEADDDARPALLAEIDGLESRLAESELQGAARRASAITHASALALTEALEHARHARWAVEGASDQEAEDAAALLRHAVGLAD